MHEVLVNRLGGLSLPRKSVVRLTDRPDMTLDVYRGRKTTIQFSIFNSHNFTGIPDSLSKFIHLLENLKLDLYEKLFLMMFLSSPLAGKGDIVVTILVRCMCVRPCVRPSVHNLYNNAWI